MYLALGILRRFRAISTLELNPALEVLSTPAQRHYRQRFQSNLVFDRCHMES
jgi:hypothetical protein